MLEWRFSSAKQVMKTTITLRDDLLRRLKARAALRGESLGRYMEASLERALQEDENESEAPADWIGRLPSVSAEALEDLERVFTSEDFRRVDPEMWK